MSLKDYFTVILAIMMFIYLMYKWASALDPDKHFPHAKVLAKHMPKQLAGTKAVQPHEPPHR